MPGIDPAKYAEAGTEHAHQVAVFIWAAQNFKRWPELWLMFSIPNGGERNKIVAAKLKAEGVKSDVPDIFLPVSRGPWHGLFIEMKRPKGVKGREGIAGDDQLEMHSKLRAQGFGVMIAVGWEAATKALISYLDWHC